MRRVVGGAAWRTLPATRRLVAASVLIMLLGASCGSAASAAVADDGGFGVSPGLFHKTTLAHNHFSYAVPPGASLTDSVVITALGTRAESINVYAVDMISSTTGGGFAPAQRYAKTLGVGSWIHLSRNRISVPGNRSTGVTFSLHVPADAVPGDHLGAIIASTLGSPGPSGLRVERRLALTVDVRVLGKILPGLKLTDVRYDQARHDFSVEVHNTGNVLTYVRGIVKVDGLRLKLGPTGVYVIPQGQARFNAHWASPPVIGHVTALAIIQGSVPGYPPFEDRQRITLWILPWSAIAPALTGLLILIAGLILSRNRISRLRARRRYWRDKKRELLKTFES